MIEIAVSLQQAEAFPAALRHAADSMLLLRIEQRPPKPLVSSGPNKQSVGIVHFRSEIRHITATVLAHQKHARQRGYPQFFHRLSQENTGLHTNSGLIAWLDDKSVCPGGTGTIQERIQL